MLRKIKPFLLFLLAGALAYATYIIKTAKPTVRIKKLKQTVMGNTRKSRREQRRIDRFSRKIIKNKKRCLKN